VGRALGFSATDFRRDGREVGDGNGGGGGGG